MTFRSLVAIIPTLLICLHLKCVMSGKPCAKPPVCYCNTDMTEVYCNVGRLTSIPELPVTAVTVDLSNNKIATIPPRAFAKLSKLQQLYLSYNDIRTLEPLTFEGLDNLTYLSLYGNNISRVPPRAFMQLTKLENLDLSYAIYIRWSPLRLMDYRILQNLILVSIQYRIW